MLANPGGHFLTSLGKIEEDTFHRRRRPRAVGALLLSVNGPDIHGSARLREAAELSFLVVEADPEHQEQMARALRRQGHRVVGAGSGSGALALISEWDVDLVLVSADLPGGSGVDVARALVRARPHTRVVMVAHQMEPAMVAASRAVGALGCVPKPLRPESLAPWFAPTNNALTVHEAVAE